MVADPSFLQVAGLEFSYGQGPVLRGIDLEVKPGERVALLGRNGSGKSTLLGLIAGVLQPARGRICFRGEDLREMASRTRARQIAMVPQTLPIPFAFTLREWVSLGRTPYLSALRGEREEDRAAVRTALELAQVTELAGRLVGEVSGGERQRAALAMALAQEPQLLLLDEATAHLDLHHQVGLLGLVQRLNQERGLTVVAAIHDMNLAALWFDRLILLHDGKVYADGPPMDVLQPEVLEAVFECRVEVLPHPAEGVPLVALRRPSADCDEEQD